MKHKSLNQLLCAATVNVRFREALLHDPAQAIAAGYFDHTFSLTTEERDLVVGIRAERLEDFAAQVYHWISGGQDAYGHSAKVPSYNGNGRNGHRTNGNGNGHRHDQVLTSDTIVDLFRAPALASA
jgi:hypothetical protein